MSPNLELIIGGFVISNLEAACSKRFRYVFLEYELDSYLNVIFLK